ncbi:hypothetical protein [Haloferula sp.]|uniref:hypothetical protein n=1 Tax=Haloferula sp. TaxID=2497595 RepID=UPI003C77607F
MNHRRHGYPRWCRRTLKVVAGLIGLLVLGFLLLQALLATSWIRAKVATKASQRLGGLPVSIEAIGWTPWSGASIRGLKVGQPQALADVLAEPLLEVDRVHAWPDYESAMNREWRVHELSLESPRFHVSVEMLASVVADAIPEVAAPVTPMVVAEVAREEELFSPALTPIPGLDFEPVDPGPITPPIQVEVPDLPDPGEEIPVEPEVQKVEEVPTIEPDEKAVKEAPEDVQSPPPVVKAVPVKKEKPRRLRVRIDDGSFELVRVGGPEPLLALRGIQVDLPLFGAQEETDNSLGLLEILGATLEENLLFQVERAESKLVVTFPDDETKDSKLSGSVLLNPVLGLPFQGELNLRMSSIGPLKPGGGALLEGEAFKARLLGNGWLLAPGSLTGVAEWSLDGLKGSVAGQELSFDSASGSLQLSSGLIQSPDTRLISDNVSLLGNGWLTAREGAAVLRVVVPFASVSFINAQFGKRQPQGRFSFKPLQPDNRWYSDVLLWREAPGWSIQFGDGGSVVPLDQL